jgi:hypothetical protein
LSTSPKTKKSGFPEFLTDHLQYVLRHFLV